VAEARLDGMPRGGGGARGIPIASVGSASPGTVPDTPEGPAHVVPAPQDGGAVDAQRPQAPRYLVPVALPTRPLIELGSGSATVPALPCTVRESPPLAPTTTAPS
jgi:hypothetical protein